MKVDYKKIYQIARSVFEKTDLYSSGPYDETFYTLRVYETAKIIIKKVGQKVDKEALLTACILHDIGKTKLDASKIFKKNTEGKKHAMFGAELAEKLLRKRSYPKEFIEKVCYLIKYHESRNKNLEKTLELQILQDADLIADWGISGFIRPFLFAGRFKRPTIKTVKYLAKTDIAEEYEKLNLEVSKNLAKEEIKEHESLIEKMIQTIKSDLLKNG